MTLKEALELTRGIRISDDENSLCFKAMVIFWIGANYGYDKVKTAKTTKYSEDDVEIVFNNWRKSEILDDGKIIGQWDGENDWMEVILISMCGAGDIVRFSDKYGTPELEQKEGEMKIKFFNLATNKFDKDMSNPKTLNEHLFAQLDRLSSADESTIKAEVEKASTIVMVSEQILNVARLKLEIMQAAGNLAEFSEIDSVKSLPDANQQGQIEQPEQHDETDPDEELVNYGGRMVSKKTLGNRKFTHPSID
jgi:hypothetical protein